MIVTAFSNSVFCSTNIFTWNDHEIDIDTVYLLRVNDHNMFICWFHFGRP